MTQSVASDPNAYVVPYHVDCYGHSFMSISPFKETRFFEQAVLPGESFK